MSIWRTPQDSVHTPNHDQPGCAGSSRFGSSRVESSRFGSGLLRCGLAAVMLAASCFGQRALAATDADAMSRAATLTPVQPDSGSITVDPGKDVTLAAAKKVDDQGVAGQKVDWSVTGPGIATLSPSSSSTSLQSGTSDAGVARTVFHARTPGSYVVTATTQKNPGCSTPSCATYVSIRYAVDVAAASTDSGSDSSGTNHTGVVAAAVAIGAGIAIAANNGSDHNGRAILRTLSSASGGGQTANANSPLAQPLLVHASNDGASAGSIAVQWSASGGAVLSSPLSFSDANGIAGVRVLSVGPGPGPVVVTARRTDAPDATASFTINVTLPSLTIVSGDGQSGFTSTQVENPLVVAAQIGTTPQAGVPIAWAITGGDAVVTSVSNGGGTDTAGHSSATITFGPTAGPVDVTATRTDGTGLSQTFHLTSVITRTLSIVSGDDQSGPPNAALPTPLVVHAQTNNADASGVTINWTADNGATLGSPTSVTNGAGQTTNTVTNTGGSIGPIHVTATRADDPTATVMFTETIFPPNLSIVSGDAQSGLIGSAATAPLIVKLVDGAGMPMSGQAITWTVTSGSATLASSSSNTDGSGQANISFSYGGNAGPIVISASAFSGTQTVNFNATAVTANALLKITGDAQSGAPGTTLPIPLKIQIQVPTGTTVLSGVPITFAVVSGSASVTVSSAMTDALGQASTTVNLGLTPGAVSVIAQVSGGGPSATFAETVTGSLVPGVLTVISGDKQVIAPKTPSVPMVVELKGNGSPLVGQTITWSTTSGNLSVTSSVTDASGRASATITPSASGPITVTASFPGFAQYVAAEVTFSQNTTLGSLPALTTNDQQIGAALDSACSDLQKLSTRTPQQQDLLNQCLALNGSSGISTSATATAIHELTPDVTQTQTQTARTATTAQFTNLAGRMNALRSGAHGASFAGLALTNSSGSLPLFDVGSVLLGLDDKPKQDAADSFSRWGMFASGQIGRQSASAQGSTPGYNLDVHGLTFGVDYRENDSLVLGGALGYTRQTTNLSGNQGDLRMNGWSLSGYATWYRKSNWYLDSALTWANNNYDSRRRISFTLPQPGGGTAVVDQIARASSGGNDLSGSLTFGRDFNNKAWAYGFYGKAEYSHQNFDAFQESLNVALPGSGLGLRVDARSESSVSSVLGGKLDFTHSTDWGVMVPHAELEWQHEFRTDPNAFRAFFVNDPNGTPILIHGDAIDSDYFKLGLGMSFVFPKGRSGFILYDKTLGRSGITQDNLSIGFRMEF